MFILPDATSATVVAFFSLGLAAAAAEAAARYQAERMRRADILSHMREIEQRAEEHTRRATPTRIAPVLFPDMTQAEAEEIGDDWPV